MKKFIDYYTEASKKNGGGSDISVAPLTVSANGTYEAEEGSAYNPVTVNVQGSDETLNKVVDADNSDPVTLSFSGTKLRDYAFYYNTNALTIDAPNMMAMGYNVFQQSTGRLSLNAPLLTTLSGQSFKGAHIDRLVVPSLVGPIPANSFDGVYFRGRFDFPAMTNAGDYSHQAFVNLNKDALYEGGTLLSFPVATSVWFYKSSVTEFTQDPNENALPGTGKYRIYAPATTTILGQNSSYACFKGCTALSSVKCLNVETVGVYAFSGCTALKKAYFKNIESIGNSAFNGCSAIKALVLDIDEEDSIPTLGTSVFVLTPIASGTGYIYITDSKVDELKAATNWSTYAAQIKPLSEYVEE